MIIRALTGLLLTLTDVSITCAVVIFRVKVSFITSGFYRNRGRVIQSWVKITQG